MKAHTKIDGIYILFININLKKYGNKEDKEEA